MANGVAKWQITGTLKPLPSKVFQVPSGSAVYFLIKNGLVVYVGQSPNVFSRLARHSIRDYDSIGILPAPADQLLKLEQYWIAALKPEYNETGKNGIPIAALESPHPRVLRDEWPRVYWRLHHGNFRLCVDSRKVESGQKVGSRKLVKTKEEALKMADHIAKVLW